jgi:hypothetical protein
MQKGMEFNMIVALILAIVGVGLFIMFVAGDLESAAASLYCKTFAKISGGPESAPEMCRDKMDTLGSFRIESGNKETASREILSYIIACWEKTDAMKIKDRYVCYDLRLPGNLPGIGENDITQILINEDRCLSIENADYGCGVLDQIHWEVEGGALLSQTILFIEYDPSIEAIRVLG